MKQEQPGVVPTITNAPATVRSLSPSTAPVYDTSTSSAKLAATTTSPAPSVAPGAPPVSLAASDTASGEAGAFGQNFARVTPKARAKAAGTRKNATDSVLVSFRVEQAGRELRIIDKDGSVYTGGLQLVDTRVTASETGGWAAPAAATKEPAAAPAPAPESAARPHTFGAARVPEATADKSPARSYFFRVAGTNLSLHQKVVFTGSFNTSSNLGALAGNAAASDRTPKHADVPTDAIPLPNATISGKVQVGRTRAIDIQAAPATP
jgi:hypothetical protein